MTLRDWFAGMAYAKEITASGNSTLGRHDLRACIYRTWHLVDYEMADAMLEARKES